MLRTVITCTVIVGLAACSSSEETTNPAPSSSGGSSGASGSSSSGSSGNTTSSASSSGTTVATLKAPKIDEVNKMMGTLHVIWTNQETTCESVVGERKAEMSDGTVHEQYKEVFTVPGEADNKHETTATETTMKYTYRLRCKKGDAFSEYSNELGGTP